MPSPRRDRFYAAQQQFVDELLARTDTLSLAACLWSMGPLSRAERAMFPTLKAIHLLKAYEAEHGTEFCDECRGSGTYYIDGEPQQCICTEPQS